MTSASQHRHSDFLFDETVIELAREISIGDLLDSATMDERTICGVLQLISHTKANLMRGTKKSVAEKVLQVDLQDLYNAIGQEDFDRAFEFCRQNRPQPASHTQLRQLVS